MIKLETRGITYSIDGKIIIDGIDISVKEGEFVGIVGPNGCGKSTLLKNIYKVFTPDSGEAFIDGEDLSKLSNRKIEKKMSVMQQENIVDFDMTVYDMVILGRFAHQKILKKQGLTILCCVHDLNIASVYCDKIILMKNKKIFNVGSPKEMLTRENIKKLFDIGTHIIENEKTGRLNIIFMPEE